MEIILPSGCFSGYFQAKRPLSAYLHVAREMIRIYLGMIEDDRHQTLTRT